MKKHWSYIFLFVLFSGQCRPKADTTLTSFPGKPEVPLAIKMEHEYLLEQMQKMTLWKDSTGHVAIKLFELMQHHFKEEEAYVLPPLGLLPLVSSGQLPEQMDEVIGLTEKFKSQLEHFSAEHQLIRAFMDELMQAAAEDHHPGAIEFEKRLHQHATTEEEIYFPAAIMLGEYLKLKSEPKN